MEINYEEEFREFMWQIGNFLRERGYVSSSDILCAATVAAWSLQHEQSELTALVKVIKGEETKAAIKKYVDFYKELQVISAQYGKEIIEYGMKSMREIQAYNNQIFAS